MLLTEYLDDSFEYNGKEIFVDMSFDNILNFYELTQDDDFNDIEKVYIGIEMLTENLTEDEINELSFSEAYELYKYILREFLDEDIDSKVEDKGNEEEQNKDFDGEEQSEEKTFDFAVDSERIYASFMMDYKIDLIDQQGKLHWNKFIALFNGLSNETPFKKVIEIRTMKVPKQTKHNAEQVRDIQKQKRKYSLGSKDMNTALSEVARFFKGSQDKNKKLKEAGDKIKGR